MRTVRVAVQTTWLALAAMLAFPLLPGHGPVAGRLYPAVLLAAAVGVCITHRLPWPRLFEAGWGLRLMYAWSSLDIVLVTLGIAATGYGASEMFIIYALTTIFFAASYPPRGQAALLAFTVACYVTVLLIGGEPVSAASFVLRISGIGLTAFMASFLSRELMTEIAGHLAARAESEQRASMLAMVARAARTMSTLESDRVLGVVVDSAIDLRFDGSEICMFDEASDTWTVVYHRGIAADYIRTQRSSAGLAGEVRRRRETIVLDDYSSFEAGVTEVRDAGFHAMVASPVFSGNDLVGVLMAGSRSWRPILPYEVECLELLAAQAGAALINAHRYSERRAFEQRLQHQAFHDDLTGLPNRTLFIDRLHHALAGLQRETDPLAVLFLDLDRFKMINDSLGHDVGDQLLTEVAARLAGCLRPSDTLGRYGGDEFTVLLEKADAAEAVAVAERILEALQLPFFLAGREVRVGTSIGISLAPSATDAAADPLREADLAMYRAKERGRGRWEIFEPEMNRTALERLESEIELAQAIDREEFTVAYQPIVALPSGVLTGVEALVRWNHPRLGVVSPAEFIPLAEETGAILALGRWVLAESCRQAREWQRQGVPPLQLHVNLSAYQFQQRDLVAQVAKIVKASGISPGSLTLEITESVVVEDVESTVEVMGELNRLGVHLALDDFGCGYSSLSYLKRFPLRTVKIDRSFVEGLVNSSEDRAIVRSVVMLAEEMHMSVTAEGVETPEQLDLVAALGCNEAQGYYFSEPVDGNAVAVMALANTTAVTAESA